jgi:hypothetical protein
MNGHHEKQISPASAPLAPFHGRLFVPAAELDEHPLLSEAQPPGARHRPTLYAVFKHGVLHFMINLMSVFTVLNQFDECVHCPISI